MSALSQINKPHSLYERLSQLTITKAMPNCATGHAILWGMESGTLGPMLWAFSLAAAICSTLFGVILSYHWFAFGSNNVVSIAALLIYASGALILIVALVALAAAL